MVKKKRNIELTQVTQWEDGKATRVEDYLQPKSHWRCARPIFPRSHSTHPGRRRGARGAFSLPKASSPSEKTWWRYGCQAIPHLSKISYA